MKSVLKRHLLSVVLGMAITLPALFSAMADEAKVGGPFTLINQDGLVTTEADFKGRFLLVFFGYTYCPDVCPTTLITVSNALDILGPDAALIAPLFISVDPERDSAAVLKGYLSSFNPKIVGLTGTAEQVAAVAGAFQAPYEKIIEPGADPEYYAVGHPAFLYLMAPNGDFLGIIGYQDPPEKMAKLLRKKIHELLPPAE